MQGDLNIPIGTVIKAWREYRDLGVTEFANKAEVPKGYISSLEHNRIERPTDKRLAELAAALEVDVWDLITRQLPESKNDDTTEESQVKNKVNKSKKSVRFGSGTPVVSGNRNAVLKEAIRQLEETKLLIEQLIVEDNT